VPCLTSAGLRAAEAGAPPEDPVAAELTRCRQLLRALLEANEETQAIRQISEPAPEGRRPAATVP